jgi:oligopeptide transport system substrate-binding protein
VKKTIILLLVVVVLSASMMGVCGLLGSVGQSSSSGSEILNLADIDPTTLDPAVSTETTSAQYIMEIYSGLLKLDDQMQPSADIATQWQVSPDGLTYTFTLRQDVKFQSGKGVTASDFKYSWERAASPSTSSQTAATYLGDIVGVNDVLTGKSAEISGVKALDKYTLQVKIGSPESYFLYKMTYPTTFVVSKDNVSSGSNWWKKPDGTGPFKLGQWNQGQSLTLVRNDSFYGLKPQLSQVKYQFYSGLPMDLYETGQIDAAGVTTPYIDEVMDKSGPYYQQLAITPALNLEYIGFNCGQAPFDDLNVRRAFSEAIDKDRIVTLIFRDMEEKANGILPPGMPGYNQNLAGLNFHVDQAMALIKASKYGSVGNLPSITLTSYGYAGQIGPVLQALVYQWKNNLGVDVKIRQLEPERYFYNTKSEIDQMFDTGWSADYPHPQDFLDILFSTGSNYNYGNYSNPEVDALLKRANLTDQPPDFTLYRQAETMIVDDAACLPIAFGKNYTIIKPYVKGFTISPLGFASLDKVSVSAH